VILIEAEQYHGPVHEHCLVDLSHSGNASHDTVKIAIDSVKIVGGIVIAIHTEIYGVAVIQHQGQFRPPLSLFVTAIGYGKDMNFGIYRLDVPTDVYVFFAVDGIAHVTTHGDSTHFGLQPLGCKNFSHKIQGHIFVQPRSIRVFSSWTPRTPYCTDRTGFQMPVIKLPVYSHKSTRLMV
jgi:hypothetical protein